MKCLGQRNKRIGSVIQDVDHKSAVFEKLARELESFNEKLERIAIACENIAESTDFLAASSED